MEATAACSSASLARSLASSPLPHRRSRVCVPERRRRGRAVVAAAASTGNYVVPLDAAPLGITRPLVEILRDLNKRVPETIVLPSSRRASASDPVIPWYHANRMLSFYAPGWCGEVRDVIYNENGKVTVVYRVTIRGIDGEFQFPQKTYGLSYISSQSLQGDLELPGCAGSKSDAITVHREAAGTASLSDARLDDPVAAAEEAAFCKACARFGFGLYLYHEDEVL